MTDNRQENSAPPETQAVIVDEEGLCPTCGYFAGSLLSCPRCGARVEKRIAVKIVKIASLAGSVLGVLLLWYAAHVKQPKQIHVEDIDERMNGAYIKVVGKVASYVEDVPRNTLKMTIEDGTGKIGVMAFNKLSQFKKIHKDNLPGLGDLVEVAGSVSETQKFGIGLFLPVPERVRILKKLEPKKYNIADIKTESIGEIVEIRVFVSSYEEKKTKKGSVFYVFMLSDETGSIGMTVFDSVMEKMPEETRKMFLEKGTELDMTVMITEYHGAPQISIFDFAKIAKVGTVDIDAFQEKLTAKRLASVKPNKFKKLRKKDLGESYIFKGTVKGLRKMGKGVVVTLDDGSDDMSVVVWDTLADKIKGYKNLKEDAVMSGIFQIGEYRDDLQLKIAHPEDVKIEPGKSTAASLEIIQDDDAGAGKGAAGEEEVFREEGAGAASDIGESPLEITQDEELTIEQEDRPKPKKKK
ncbi:MAG TPA: hypothetical protein P5079_00980 [Elusimicrobiota bacterium]|nr:hypothetical protein [Elusimicrobiota bacterium]